MTDSNPLVRGICLIPTPDQRYQDDGRLELSAGITRAATLYPALPYRPRAFVPGLPWRKPTRGEMELLVSAHGEEGPGDWIQLLRMPDEILERFAVQRAASDSIRQKADLRSLTESAECRETLAQAVEDVRRFAAPDGPLDGAGLFGNPPGLPTTTLIDADHLNGLHVDNFSRATLPVRARSPNRIAINVGAGDRFLLYINLSLGRISSMLADGARRSLSSCDRGTTRLRFDFMDAFPHYPVVKLRIRPGEAYIAPTENIIHDGCTIGQRHFDLRFSVRGLFRPAAFGDHRFPEGRVAAQ